MTAWLGHRAIRSSSPSRRSYHKTPTGKKCSWPSWVDQPALSKLTRVILLFKLSSTGTVQQYALRTYGGVATRLMVVHHLIRVAFLPSMRRLMPSGIISTTVFHRVNFEILIMSECNGMLLFPSSKKQKVDIGEQTA